MKKIFLALALFGMTTAPAVAEGFKLTSSQIAPGSKIGAEQVFNGFGCTGGNISPELKWSGAPKGTKSYALTVFDSDAPTGSGWWHWVIFNIPADTNGLAKGAGALKSKLLPEGAVQSRTDFGKPGYGGPCPSKGDKPHRYSFTLHALKTDKLPLDMEASAAMVGFYLHLNTLSKAVLMANYSR